VQKEDFYLFSFRQATVVFMMDVKAEMELGEGHCLAHNHVVQGVIFVTKFQTEGLLRLWSYLWEALQRKPVK